MTSPEQQLVELGIQLPPPSVPKGAYRSVVVAGGLASTAGHLPTYPDGGLVVGKVGLQLDTQAGYEAARLAGLAILASVRAELGSLDRVQATDQGSGARQLPGGLYGPSGGNQRLQRTVSGRIRCGCGDRGP